MLEMDLQNFAEGEESAEFDLDAFVQQFESEFEESSEDEEEVSEDEEEEQPSEEEEGATSKAKEVQPPDVNSRFAEMRRELEESRKYVDFIKELADKNAMTPEQLLEAYKQRELEEQSKKENIPVEVLQRLQTLEADNMALKTNYQRERFNAQVESTKEKYKLSDDDVRDIFVKAQQENLDLLNIPFERVYQLVNFDKIVEERIEASRQKELEDRKKRTERSAVPHTTGSSKDEETSDVGDEVVAYLKDRGAI